MIFLYCHILWTVAHAKFICVSVCLSFCLSIGPAFTAYISLTLGRILIKLGENVGNLVRLIVLKFHKNQLSFDVIMTSFLFFFSVISKVSNSAQRDTTLR